jgi:tetratricopeptide (TPR) repeat protein
LLGFIRYTEQRWQESRAEFEEAAKHRDLSAVELKMLGLDCLALDLYADADKWLTRSLEMEPGDAGAWQALGEVRTNEQQFEAAIQAYQRSLALVLRVVTAETSMGWCAELLSRLEDAATAYRTAMSWEAPKPDDPTPYLGLGRVLLKQNRPAEALPYLRQAVQMEPASAEAHEELGKAYSLLNELAAAQQEIEKAMELAPKVVRLHFMLGQLYRRTGQMEKAKAELDSYAASVGAHSTPDQDPR